MVEIRALGPAGAEAYWSLRLEALESDSLAFGSSAEETRAAGFETTTARHLKDASGGNFMMGAFLDGRLVGLVGLSRAERSKQRHMAGVVSMYVAPAARERGVGRELLAALIDRARGYDDLERLGLSVATHATAARALYRSLGFVAYGIEPQALKVGDAYADMEHMTLALH